MGAEHKDAEHEEAAARRADYYVFTAAGMAILAIGGAAFAFSLDSKTAFAGDDVPPQIKTINDAAWSLYQVRDKLDLIVWVFAGATALATAVGGYLAIEIVKLNKFMGTTETELRQIKELLKDVASYLGALPPRKL